MTRQPTIPATASIDPHLSVLLSRVLASLVTEVEEAAGVGTNMPSLAVWSNVLRCVNEGGSDGLDERRLPEAARISSRLATAAVTGAARRGWISAEAGTAGGKSRHLQLTDVGQSAALRWPERLAALDAAWGGEPLRVALEGLVGKLPLELSHMPTSYGAADPSAIGGPFVQNHKRTDGVPAHGKDWKPVPRGEGDSVSELPLTALLSQALMAFTIHYEDRFPWPLANTATVLRHIGAEPRPLSELPDDHGITGNGKSLLERHLIVNVTKDASDPHNKLVSLTDRGLTVMTHHPRRLEAVHAEWRERFGDSLIAGLRDELTRAASSAGAETDHLIAPLDRG